MTTPFALGFGRKRKLICWHPCQWIPGNTCLVRIQSPSGFITGVMDKGLLCYFSPRRHFKRVARWTERTR